MLMRQHALERNWSAAGLKIRIWRYGQSRQNNLVVLLCCYRKRTPRMVGRTLHRNEQNIARKLAEPRRRDWLMGRWLAHLALHLNASQRCHGWITYDEHGAPVQRLAGARSRLSISHIDKWVGVAVHRSKRVGLDIEADMEFPAGATRYFLHSTEVENLANTANFPMNAWVVKEAAYKALHCKAVNHLKDLQILAHSTEKLETDQHPSSFTISRRSDGKKSNVEYSRFEKLKINFGLAIV
jgi:4'-phosphopantetheinyl transferase EntD